MKKSLFIVLLFAFTSAFFSCSSTPKEIPEMTSQELIQNGQTNYEAGNYKAALVWYETAIERFSDWPNVYIEARYEIGHVYMKQKKYTKAQAVFNEIIEIYKNSTPGSLPAAYKKLAEIELAKIK
jgi:outer membrane protein assembly factor BamD (BamD/ComL family)